MIETIEHGTLRGFLHSEPRQCDRGLVLTHGAGSNCNAPLLVDIAGALASHGVAVLRCNLPYRNRRPTGPPSRGDAAADREGLRSAVEWLRAIVTGPVFLGGHSYGGRQSTMLAAEDPGIAEGLLLLSYPLHPPRQRDQLRTSHFPALQTGSLFVHGTRDPFGLPDEMLLAVSLIPAVTRLELIDGCGHDLKCAGIADRVVSAFGAFFS